MRSAFGGGKLLRCSNVDVGTGGDNELGAAIPLLDDKVVVAVVSQKRFEIAAKIAVDDARPHLQPAKSKTRSRRDAPIITR